VDAEGSQLDVHTRGLFLPVRPNGRATGCHHLPFPSAPAVTALQWGWEFLLQQGCSASSCSVNKKITTLMPTEVKPRSKHVSSDYHTPRTVEDVTERNVQAILQLEEAAKANRSNADRIADLIAAFCGSMTFVWVHVIWFGAWVFVNTSPGIKPFDPFPFTFLTLIVSLEAIFLSTFILISQNHETRLSERRNHLDLQINLLTEQENTKMLRMLERIAKKVGANTDDDPSLQVLDQATNPEKLVEQIEQASMQGSNKPRGTTSKL